MKLILKFSIIFCVIISRFFFCHSKYSFHIKIFFATYKQTGKQKQNKKGNKA